MSMGQGFYGNFSVKKVILSRGRADTICTHLLVPNCDLLCVESEYEAYKVRCGSKVGKIKTIPDEIVGIAKIRNWILDHWRNKVLFMMDDDVDSLIRMGEGTGIVTKDPEIIEQVIDNTARCAMDAGCHVFGFNLTPDIRKFRENVPFRFATWVDTTWGVIGRDLRFDENQFVKEDFDYCLASLKRHRIIWTDARYYFSHKSRSNKGGLTMYRTDEREKADFDYLKLKWGRHVAVRDAKGTVKLFTNVRRKQAIGKT